MVLVGWTFAVTGDFFLLRKTWCDGTLSFGGVNGPYIDILWLKQCHNHPFGNGLYMFIPSICGDLGDGFLLFYQHYTYIHTYIHACIHTYIPTYVRTYIHTYIHTYIQLYIYIADHASEIDARADTVGLSANVEFLDMFLECVIPWINRDQQELPPPSKWLPQNSQNHKNNVWGCPTIVHLGVNI